MGLGKVVLKRKLVFFARIERGFHVSYCPHTPPPRRGPVGYLDLHGRLCLARRGLEGQ